MNLKNTTRYFIYIDWLEVWLYWWDKDWEDFNLYYIQIYNKYKRKWYWTIVCSYLSNRYNNIYLECARTHQATSFWKKITYTYNNFIILNKGYLVWF